MIDVELEEEYQKAMKYPEQVFGFPSQRVYKLRNKETGLFRSAGRYGRDHKVGKSWNTRGAVKLHLNLLGNRRKDYILEEYELRFVGKEDLK